MTTGGWPEEEAKIWDSYEKNNFSSLQKLISAHFLSLVKKKMQVERSNVVGNLHEQRSRLFARIPPHIDLTAVTTSTETENRWKSSSHMTNINNKNSNSVNSTGSSFNKPLHVKTTNIENTICVKMGTDLLPIGELVWIENVWPTQVLQQNFCTYYLQIHAIGRDRKWKNGSSTSVVVKELKSSTSPKSSKWTEKLFVWCRWKCLWLDFLQVEKCFIVTSGWG